jgi:hypothetical protein
MVDFLQAHVLMPPGSSPFDYIPLGMAVFWLIVGIYCVYKALTS